MNSLKALFSEDKQEHSLYNDLYQLVNEVNQQVEKNKQLQKENKSIKNAIAQIERRYQNMGRYVHDSANKVLSIMSFMKFSNKYPEKREFYKRFLESNARELWNLQERTMSYYKGIDRTYIKPYSLRKVLEEIKIANDAEYNPTLDIHVECQLDTIFNTDKNILASVINNAVKNTYEAIRKEWIRKQNHPPKSVFNILAYDIDTYQKKVKNPHLFRNKKKGGIAIILEDNAGGISKEQVAHFFDFGSTADKKHGHGIGTYSMKMGIEKDLKWNIMVESELGKGLRFHIYLPPIACKQT
ncbi:MAG: ATP-binding protein [Candidatus Margulisbacteria bacterium]|nr:ATP-binding protein [Candidatus Margulisiibacteriota bacterium]